MSTACCFNALTKAMSCRGLMALVPVNFSPMVARGIFDPLLAVSEPFQRCRSRVRTALAADVSQFGLQR
ncbi:hypothetical protein, partial [Kitasatospora cinereorecta]|uniref:hypothetical protein n=1 Tax=Kitasatospora cinereorecta TaxID=285560 RepID=UPI0031F998A5